MATPRARRPPPARRPPEPRSWRPWPPAALVDAEGEQAVAGGRPVEPGDALVVATSGTTGDAEGRRAHPRRRGRVGPATSARLDVDDHDGWLACLPLSHVGGLSVVTRAIVTGTPAHGAPGLRRHRRRGGGAGGRHAGVAGPDRAAPHRSRAVPGDRARRLPPAGRAAGQHGRHLRPDRDRQRRRLRRPPARRGRGPRHRRRRDPAPRARCCCAATGTAADPKDADGWLPTGDLGGLDGRRPAPCARPAGGPDRDRAARTSGRSRSRSAWAPTRPWPRWSSPGGRTRSGASGSSPSWCPAPRTAVPASTRSGTG